MLSKQISFRTNFLLLLSSLLITACGGGDSGDAPAPTPAPEQKVSSSWESGCNNSYKHFVKFDGTNMTFKVNSEIYRDVNCAIVSRTGTNVLYGIYKIGNKITAAGGFTVTEFDVQYDALVKANVKDFDPAPFDIYYLDTNSNTIYLGLKTLTEDGSSKEKRPTTIDFNNAWSVN